MNSSVDNRYDGLRAEVLVEHFLLQFLSIAKPTPDEGIDLVGWFRTRECLANYGHICFYFQTKSGNEFRLSKRRFRELAILSENAPVVLMFIPGGSKQVRYCVLFEWLLRHPGAVNSARLRQTVSVPESEFDAADVAEFRRVLVREADRVAKSPDSVWRTHQSAFMPLSFLDMLSHLGRLQHVEPSKPIIDLARLSPQSILPHDHWWYLREIQSGSLSGRKAKNSRKMLREWMDSLSVEPVPTMIKSQLTQFERFVRSMTEIDSGARWPRKI